MAPSEEPSSSADKDIPVRVAVRIRPLVTKEIREGCQESLCVGDCTPQVILKGTDKAFTFDYAFSVDAPQHKVYDDAVAKVVNQLFHGYNVTILANGQTGSGKTYSIGTAYVSSRDDDLDMGIIPRAVIDIFNGCKERENYTFTIKLSYYEFKIGSNSEPFVDYRIDDCLISSTHVVLKKGSLGEWTIQNVSHNSIVLNEEEIFQNETRPLVAGSILKLRTSDGVHSFNFRDQEISNEKIEALRYCTKKRKKNSEEVEEAHNNEIKRKMKEKLKLEEKLREEDCNRLLILKEKLALEFKQEKKELVKKFEDEQREREEQLLNEKEELRKKLLVIEEQNAKLENEMKNREKTQKDVQDSKRKEEEEKKLALEDLKMDIEYLEMQLEILRCNLEEKDLLTSSLETELLEADKAREQVSDLQKRLKNLEEEKCSLQQQASKEVDSITDVVEKEFQCSICKEILMTAMMLNCGHVVCKFCIDYWKRTKRECPNCRASITTETRAYVLDNFIDKIVSRLSEDLKLRRKNTIVEREAELKAYERTEEEVSNERRGWQRARRGRRNGPQGRSNGAGSTPSNPIVIGNGAGSTPSNPIVIESPRR